MELQLELNGERETFTVERSDLLLDVLRGAGYTGAKRGCDTGACGSCTVLVDGEATQSCVVPAARVDGSSVETVEGLGTQDDLHPIQQAFVDYNATQCGFCIPGMIMSAKELLDETDDPDEDEVREAIDGNLCRCTGYVKPIESILSAAAQQRGEDVAADGGVELGCDRTNCCSTEESENE